MSISGEDLKKIPYKATLKGDWDDATQSMVIRAALENADNQNIVFPGGQVIHGT